MKLSKLGYIYSHNNNRSDEEASILITTKQKEIMNHVKTSITDSKQELFTRLQFFERDILDRINELRTTVTLLLQDVSEFKQNIPEWESLEGNIDKLRSQITDVGSPIKLTLNTHYEGELYLIKIGNSGYLHGIVKSKQAIVSTNPICSIPVPYNFRFVTFTSQGSQVEIKIDTSNLYFTKSHTTSNLTVSIYHIIYQSL